MAQVQLRFYEELNDFLPPERRKTPFAHDLTRRTSVKDLIESFGVPHTEVEVILANGEPVDFPISCARTIASGLPHVRKPGCAPADTPARATLARPALRD